MKFNLRIAVICHALKAGGGVFVGQNCVAALKRHYSKAEFFVSIPEGLGYETYIGNERTQYDQFRQKNYLQQWIYENYFLPKIINYWKPDVILNMANRALPSTNSPQLLLLHDAHLFYTSKYYAGESKLRKFLKVYQRMRLNKDLRRISFLLVQTSTAAKRVSQLYDYDKEITKLPNALSNQINTNKIFEIPAKYKKFQSYSKFFYLTRYYPHKNIELIVEAFEKFPNRLKKNRVFITISEDQHKLAKKLLMRIRKANLEERIINLGPLKQDKIGGYFQHCDALLMPSTLESFSGTYLEAMAFKKPIITSDLDFAKEICGDAAIYFNPWSSEDLCEAIERFENDRELNSRLVKNGINRLFELRGDWDKNAEIIAQLISTLN